MESQDVMGVHVMSGLVTGTSGVWAVQSTGKPTATKLFNMLS